MNTIWKKSVFAAGCLLLSSLILWGMTGISTKRMYSRHMNQTNEAVTVLLPAAGYEELPMQSAMAESQYVRHLYRAFDVSDKTIGYIVFTVVPGYNGNMEVNISTNAEGSSIEQLRIGANAETEGLGKKAESEKFYSQFSGLKPPISFQDIQAISGATITTEAIVYAANLAAAIAKENSILFT